MQLEGISSHATTCYRGEKIDTHFTMTSFQVAVDLLHNGILTKQI